MQRVLTRGAVGHSESGQVHRVTRRQTLVFTITGPIYIYMYNKHFVIYIIIIDRIIYHICCTRKKKKK